MKTNPHIFLNPLVACVCAGFTVSSHAQLMDDVELRQEGSNAVAEIKFVTPVQYSKAISARASDLVQAFYTALPTRLPLNLETSERRLPGGAGLPSMVIRDETANSTAQSPTARKLVIRFGVPTRFKVRAGRNNRSIEIVLEGLGEAAKNAQASAPKPLPKGLPGSDASATVKPASPEAAAAEVVATNLLATAQSAYDGGQYDAATQSLNELLNLPPNASSRKAQELAGLARLNAGDKPRAASEFELFLKLYPEGTDSDRVRQLLAFLPTVGAVAQANTKPVVEATSTTSGSLSTFYYGGKSDTRTQEFKDSPLGGLPVLQSDTALSSVDQRQVQTNADVNWRYRDADKDMRFVVRDSYTSDLLNDSKSKERLTALYFDYRSLALGTSVRLGRQSPTGGGVLYRFDGVQLGYSFKPKWKINAVMGSPTDPLLDTRRTFYGLSLDAEALTKELSGSAYVIEQLIDGETDRRGLGADLRYFKGGMSASGQVDYDQILKAVNIAAFQSTWQMTEATVINAMFDRRTTPMLSLGNVLFFQDPALAAPAKRIQELLGTTPIETLREQVKGLTAYQNQFRVGGTTTLSPNWQTGADFSLTNVDEIKPVAVLLPTGQASTGNLWGVSAQLIGTNLYSPRDTHVFNLSLLGGPTYHGALVSYNNLSSLSERWQLEPSLKYYTQSGVAGDSSDVWTLGIRGIFRIRNQVSLETELTYERSDATAAPTTAGPGTTTASTRMNYYLGGRFDF